MADRSVETRSLQVGKERILTRLQWVQQIAEPVLARGVFHVGVLLIVAFAFASRGIPSPTYSLHVPTGAQSILPSSSLEPVRPTVTAEQDSPVFQEIRPQATSSWGIPSALPSVLSWAHLLQEPVPYTIIPARGQPVVMTYTVDTDDNVYTIAELFGLQPMTLLWANQEIETTPDLLDIGQELVILPVDGVYHTVAEGETLNMIAEQYHVGVQAIVSSEYNEFVHDDEILEPGQKVIVPGGVKPFEQYHIRSINGPLPEDALRGEGQFIWPVGGYISQGHWELHKAIDIAGSKGDVVVAADSGYVVYASWDTHGYGNLVVIDHGNGFVTYYAHLYGFTVDVGESIHRGQQIGARGTTGRSTGPHLHFEIRYDGALRDPITLLPGQ